MKQLFPFGADPLPEEVETKFVIAASPANISVPLK